MNALEVHDLTVSYGDIRAVKGISFTVKEGEIFTLIGANGAGKTSTLRALSGMLKYGGRVVYQGAEIDDIAADKRVGSGWRMCRRGAASLAT